MANMIHTANRLRNYYRDLLAQGYTQSNAWDKLVFDNGDVPAAVLAYAGDRALTGSDVQELTKFGISAESNY